MKRALLLLLLAFIGLALCDEKGWIVAKWEPKTMMPADEIVREFSVHAIFHNVAFIVGYASDVPLLNQKGFTADYMRVFDATEKLYVVEFNKRFTGKASRDILVSKEITKQLVWALFEFDLVVVDKQDFLESSLVKSFYWSNKAEIVSLRMKPIVPSPTFEEHPLYESLKNLKFNPVIENTLAAVSEPDIYENARFLSEEYNSRQSASTGLREAQSHVADLFRSYGLNVTTQSYFANYAENVCGDYIGTENPTALVVAGAHMDSRSTNSGDPNMRAPGAVDNGSGAAAMMEMARVLATTRVQLKNTVRICLWTGEEQGLLGSEAYVRKLENENANVLAYFNADMLGYKLTNRVITMGMKDSSITQWLLTLSFQITEQYVPDLPVDYSSSCCSDYISFYNAGYPSIGYFQNPGSASDYPDYHRSTDTYDNNNSAQLYMETQAVFAAVLTFAETVA